MAQCKYCGDFFETAGTGVVCKPCKTANLKNGQQSTAVEKECKTCGSLFIGVWSKIYCSHDCRDASYTKRRTTYVIFERDNFRCYYCGSTPSEDGVKLHADHIHPRYSGGEDVANNLITSCDKCNISKGKNQHTDKNVKDIMSYVQRANTKHGIRPDTYIKM